MHRFFHFDLGFILCITGNIRPEGIELNIFRQNIELAVGLNRIIPKMKAK